MKRISKAFTLIELLIIIVIIGMLSSLGVATYNNYIYDSKVAVIKKSVNDLTRYTILYAKENDKYYSEFSLAEMVDRFKIKEPSFTTIVYVASDTDFFYMATLPDGSNAVFAGIVPKTYAISKKVVLDKKGNSSLTKPTKTKPKSNGKPFILPKKLPPVKIEKKKNEYYYMGTPAGLSFLTSLSDTEKRDLVRASSDSFMASNFIRKYGNINLDTAVCKVELGKKGKQESKKSKPVIINSGVNTQKCENLQNEVKFTPKVISTPWEKTLSDIDLDGVPDYRDKCLREKGLEKLEGCPRVDSDGDGVYDDEDDCPDVVGDKYFYGCPLPDLDKDGIWDEEDKCPNDAGRNYNMGCPLKGDGDKDGVGDEWDKCPKEAGIADMKYRGCPGKK